ncbi:Crp/Fnr family transcriptional regulator [Phenylobacterium sp.]|uniref:Crp/Fnr family transcriptional regulator n=1 Tax=Phenylobacterium sp. TaxID=1871053 RepID=UPI0035B2CB3C
MPTPMVRKLRHGAELSEADEQALFQACATVKEVPARANLIQEGDRPHEVHVVLEGFACRFKMLPDGGRQIMAWLVPGDFCDLHVAILGEMDHNIGTLTPSRIGAIPRDQVERLSSTSPQLSRALWWATLVDEAILREWLVAMGRRPAERQIAHLFCELLARLEAVGASDGRSVELPVTQTDLADTVGLSSVHVNRVLQQLRAEELIEWREKTLTILDRPRLEALAEFNPNYLHYIRRRPEVVSGRRQA